MRKLRKLLSMMIAMIMLVGMIPSANAAVLNEPVEDSGVIRLIKSIRPLGTIASAMNSAAHPDDEGSSWLAALSLGQGVSCHVVTVTRGQGGQNAIGPEYHNAMGVLRTAELEEAIRVLDVTDDILREEYDSPCMDYGFSKKWEEAEEKWDFDYLVERIAYYIRLYRPQVYVHHASNVRSEHGQHQATYMVFMRAIEAAADPAMYPEHGLPAYQVQKVYEPGSADEHTVAIDIGAYDPLYGDTYQRISEYSRSFHACQGMGQTLYPQPATRYFKMTTDAAARITDAQQETSFFDGLPYDFDDYAELVEDEEIAAKLKKIQQDYRDIEAAFPMNAEVMEGLNVMRTDVDDALSAVEASQMDADTQYDLSFHLKKKQKQLDRAMAEAACLQVLAVADDYEVIPGQPVDVAVRIYQGSDFALDVADVSLETMPGWTVEKGETEGELGYNKTLIQHFTLTATEDAGYYNAFHGDHVRAQVTFEGEHTFAMTGEMEETFALLPKFAVKIAPEKIVINNARAIEPLEYTVEMVNNAPDAATETVTLSVPEGWTVEPASQEIAFAKSGETCSATFKVSAPADVKEGTYKLTAALGEDDQTVQAIDYQHIDKTYYLYQAEGTVEVFPLLFDENRKIGYLSAGLDTVGETLQTLGMDVTFIEDEELRLGDLSVYDTIVVGIRAYRNRAALIECNDRLLDYAKNGGHLVVQYHTSGDGYKPEYAAYPLTVGSPSLEWRVTYEGSPVTVLIEDHPFLNTPNKLDETAWDGWVQERSIYVPMEWDEAYEAPIRSGTVEQENREYDGQILTAPYGEGRFTYTALAFFRQVPNLVPGGVKLFTNIISQ
ncbi:MAG TPA: PIG-L family deacetylase [Candidatus Ventricola intestinavium]|nr:PIG-L family deacetylase [Candidatus Ventricola intestinavium]